MNKEDLNMDKAIREKLEGFSQQPPLHVWDNIQGQLLEQKRKRRIVVFSRIAAAAVVLLAFLAGWYFNEKSEQITPALTETQTEQLQNTIQNNENETAKADTDKEIKTTETQNENQIENSFEKKDNTTETVVAGKEQTNFIAEAKIQPNSDEQEILQEKENNDYNLLDRIEAFLKNEDNRKSQLKLKSISVNEISKADELLIAENILNMEDSEDAENKWKLGVQVSPGYSSQNTNYSESYSNAMTYSGESGNANITGGLSVQMKAGKKWSVESGIYYSQNGQRSTNSRSFKANSMDYGPISDAERLYFNTAVNLANGQLAMNSTAGVIQFSNAPAGTEVGSNLDGLSDASSNTLLTEGEFSQVFEFIEIPLYLRYSLIDSKFGVELLGGINAGIIAGNNVYMNTGNTSQNIGKTKDISPVNFSGTLGVGVNYALSKHISLAVEPRFNYYLNSVNQNPSVDFRPYRIGVYTGLYYGF